MSTSAIKMNTKLLIVDGHPMLLHGLRQALSEQSNLILAGEAVTGEEALKLAKELTPDLVVMDVHLPDMNGIEAARQILKVLPSSKVLIFSEEGARSLVDEALQAGVCGYILKGSAVDEVIRAIDVVVSGKLYLSPAVGADILESHQESLRIVSKRKLLCQRRSARALMLAPRWCRLVAKV